MKTNWRRLVHIASHVRDASVQLLSTIGRPADEPAVVAIALQTDQSHDFSIEDSVRQVAQSLFGQIDALTARLVAGMARGSSDSALPSVD